eukprot:895525-Pyramimonas_sp.AAC.1
MERGIVHNIQWCDTRDMAADGHTKGSIDRDNFLQVMGGTQSFILLIGLARHLGLQPPEEYSYAQE